MPASFTLSLPGHRRPFRALAVGASTGGPRALLRFLSGLGTITVPVFVTQHLPPDFTASLANQIASVAEMPCREAEEGELVQQGHIYIAPGDYHLTVRKDRAEECRLHLSRSAPENFCRPSLDPMLRSLHTCYDAHVLAVVLTGMGSDGLEAARALVRDGGTVLAQDRDSSVVWGMPGAVAAAGLCSAVVSLDSMAVAVRAQLAQDASPATGKTLRHE